MRKLLVFILIIAFTGFASANVEPRINVEEISEQPAEPGDLVKVSVVIANDGTQEGKFGPIQVRTLEDAEYVGTTSTLNKTVTLCGGCQQVGSVYIRLDEDAGSGSMPVRISVPTREISVSETSNIEVDGSPVITGSVSEVDAPIGEKRNITITVENIGSETATSSSMELQSGRFSFTPSSLNLGGLEPGERVMREIALRPDESLTSGTRRFNVTVSYTEDSERRKEAFTGSINVVDRAELTLDEFEAEELVIDQSSRVSAEIENLGPGEAENLRVNMTCSGAELSSQSAFVGQLGDGESIPASFKTQPSKENVSCRINVNYNDYKQRSFSEEADFVASEKQNNLPLIVGSVIAVILVVFFLYRRRSNELEEV